MGSVSSQHSRYSRIKNQLDLLRLVQINVRGETEFIVCKCVCWERAVAESVLGIKGFCRDKRGIQLGLVKPEPRLDGQGGHEPECIFNASKAYQPENISEQP